MNQTTSDKPLLAMCLYKYFPHGGMQRAFRRIAERLVAAGYPVKAYAYTWAGPKIDGVDLTVVAPSGTFNHTRHQRFHAYLVEEFERHSFACIVGFNKMPGLDIYYAADTCYADKAQNARSAFYRTLPRYFHFAAYERSVFEPGSATQILMMSEQQKKLFQSYYQTQEDRFVMLPPGIARDRMAGADAADLRADCRAQLDLADDQLLVLLIGSGFITKGLDRALAAVAGLPDDLRQRCHLLAIGQDSPNRYLRRAQILGLKRQFHVMSGRDDIPRFLQGADLLLHPAYFENTGNVLLEAIVAGLPVLATDVCGFAKYIVEADAGCVLQSPFEQSKLNALLANMLRSEKRALWRQNGIAFGHHADLYRLPDRAAEVIMAHADKHADTPADNNPDNNPDKHNDKVALEADSPRTSL